MGGRSGAAVRPRGRRKSRPGEAYLEAHPRGSADRRRRAVCQVGVATTAGQPPLVGVAGLGGVRGAPAELVRRGADVAGRGDRGLDRRGEGAAASSSAFRCAGVRPLRRRLARARRPARDLGVPVPGGAVTRREQALAFAGQGAPALARTADRHVFGPSSPAAASWPRSACGPSVGPDWPVGSGMGGSAGCRDTVVFLPVGGFRDTFAALAGSGAGVPELGVRSVDDLNWRVGPTWVCFTVPCGCPDHLHSRAERGVCAPGKRSVERLREVHPRPSAYAVRARRVGGSRVDGRRDEHRPEVRTCPKKKV